VLFPLVAGYSIKTKRRFMADVREGAGSLFDITAVRHVVSILGVVSILVVGISTVHGMVLCWHYGA
jgi:hypothetical protein